MNIRQVIIRYLILIFLSKSLCAIADKETSYDSTYSNLIKKAKQFEYSFNDSVIVYAEEALQIATADDPSKQLEALSLLITTEIRAVQYSKAIEHCQVANEIIEKSKDDIKYVDILIYSGIIYQSMGLPLEALEFFLKAKVIAEDQEYSQKIGNIHYYIGSVYDDIGEMDKCRDNLQISTQSIFLDDNPHRIFKSYILLSNTFENIDSVQKYLTLAESVISMNPDFQYQKVVLRGTQALVNKVLGNYAASKVQYLEAIRISKLNGFKDFLSNLYNNYAYLLMAEAKYDSARYYLDQGLDIAIHIGNLDLESEIYDSYSDYYQRINDFEQALKYADLFTEKRNEYREQQRVQESLFLSAVFETEQKEKEILQQENQINRLWMIMMGILFVLALSVGLLLYFRQKISLTRSRLESLKKGKALELADALIQGQDAERKRLAMDLHDGLGARLASLRFLVDGYFKNNKKYEDVMGAILHINQNVRELSHRMLPSQLDDHGLVLTINNLIASINKSGRFRLLFETNLETRLDRKLEINLYYLIFELINNASKHSKGDTIVVQLLEHEDAFNLSVEDNGGGFVKTATNGGMGLKNIQTRVDYLSGELAIESNDAETLFLIVIPKQLP